MCSLTSFARGDKHIELMALEDFANVKSVKKELIVKFKRNKDRRKTSEQLKEFPTTTSASVVPMRNVRTRSARALTPRRIEKQSKGNNSNYDFAEEQNCSSLNNFSNEETAPHFVQPIGNPSLQEESLNANNKEDEQED